MRRALAALLLLAAACGRPAASPPYQTEIAAFAEAIAAHSDTRTGLPYSHSGDYRFHHWTITYDAAVVALADIACGRVAAARRIVDVYRTDTRVWRLGGLMEAVDAADPGVVHEYSVRTGANLWMGLAAFHLHRATGERAYLDFACRIADFALALQDRSGTGLADGAICLGPPGEARYPDDQHIGFSRRLPAYTEIVATEIQLDAYALFGMLHRATGEARYRQGQERLLAWLARVGVNREEGRLNRGCGDTVSREVATDIQCWGVSALGVEGWNRIQPGLAARMIDFVERRCLNEVAYRRPDGKVVRVRGVDFVDRERTAALDRPPLVSPEWTCQLINAYQRLARESGDGVYLEKRRALIESLLGMASKKGKTLTLPYATQDDALIGHEHRTPRAGNVSAISAAYAILAMKGFDPLAD